MNTVAKAPPIVFVVDDDEDVRSGLMALLQSVGLKCESFASAPDFLSRIAGAPVTIDQWQLEKLALVAAKVAISFYVPGLSREYHASLWGRVHATAADAVASLAASLPAKAQIAVIPEGPYVLANVEPVRELAPT